jgi:large subunit ribosomal protein L16
MLCPRKFKFRKVKKVRVYGIELKSNNPVPGLYGVKAISSGRITSQQIESIRRLVSRKMHRSGSIRLKVFPSFPISSKPAEVRMGRGKGNIKYWCFPVKPGRLIIEFNRIPYQLATEINKLINSKLPFKTKLVKFL